MGFRKSAQSRIFVDENIPSFLKTKPENQFSSSAEAKASPPSIAAVAPMQLSAHAPKPIAKDKPAAQPVDRRSQPLQIQPAFLVKSISIIVLLNAALTIAMQSPMLYRHSVQTQASPMRPSIHSSANNQGAIVSYRYSGTQMVETP